MIPTNGTLPETRQMKQSVKDPADGQIVNFFLPYLNNRTGALPPNLPEFNTWGFYNARDLLLMATVNKEDQWGSAVSEGISSRVARTWQIDSEIAIRRKRTQNYLKEAGAGWGLFGWEKFLSNHLLSYLLTGIAYIEIERATPANGSKVINIHHLNPLQCRLTGNPRKPVNYQSVSNGTVKELWWHQVIVITDIMLFDQYQPRPQGAAERAYNTIRKLANIENYLDEKVSGRRPLSINFVSGINKRALNDMLQSAQHEADVKSLRSYMGAAIVAIPGDTAVSNVTIPVAELPDITDVDRERLRADLIYANAIGIDPQDVNPQLVGRQGLGSTGNQAQILNDKASSQGLTRWDHQFTSEINQLVMDDSTTFSFIESDLRDQGLQADNEKKRTDTQKVRIDAGIISPEQAKNVLVDAGDLPPEFIEKDATGADVLRDDQKPETEEEKRARDERPEAEQPEPPKAEETKKKEWDKLYH